MIVKRHAQVKKNPRRTIVIMSDAVMKSYTAVRVANRIMIATRIVINILIT